MKVKKNRLPTRRLDWLDSTLVNTLFFSGTMRKMWSIVGYYVRNGLVFTQSPHFITSIDMAKSHRFGSNSTATSLNSISIDFKCKMNVENKDAIVVRFLLDQNSACFSKMKQKEKKTKTIKPNANNFRNKQSYKYIYIYVYLHGNAISMCIYING